MIAETLFTLKSQIAKVRGTLSDYKENPVDASTTAELVCTRLRGASWALRDAYAFLDSLPEEDRAIWRKQIHDAAEALLSHTRYAQEVVDPQRQYFRDYEDRPGSIERAALQPVEKLLPKILPNYRPDFSSAGAGLQALVAGETHIEKGDEPAPKRRHDGVEVLPSLI